jgi:signal transduction histidine kinase
VPDEGVTAVAADGGEAAPPRIPWHVVYYLLAAFGVLTVCASLLLSRRFVEASLGAVAENQEWARHLDESASLQPLGSEAYAPVRDVLESREVAREAARMTAARSAVADRLEGLRRHVSDRHAADAAPVLAKIQALGESIHAMEAEADAMFRSLAADDAREAERRAAAVERRHAGVVSASQALHAEVARQHLERLAAQAARLRRRQRYEFLVTGLVVVMAGAAVVYGSRIEKEMGREARARDRYVRGLREAEDARRRAQADLERRVEERTRALAESEAALRQAASEWRRTFDAIGSPVLVLDLDGRLVRANAAARTVTGESPEEGVTGRMVSTWAGAEPWATASRLTGVVGESGAPAAADARDAARGRSWDVTAYPARAEDGEDGRVIVVTRDTTRELELQETLRREETMAAMGGLVAGVAHEVRNPIFAIALALDGLEARSAQSPGLDKHVAVMRREVDRLGRLARDLLDYARPTQLTTTATALSPLLDDAMRACEHEASAGSVTMEADLAAGLPTLTVDPHRMAQVFQNVIHNAVVHSPAGGRVVVSGRLQATGERRWIECSVRDSGPGFRPEDLPRVFQPLFTRRPGGTGLGLAIAHRIVDLHGGSMSAANDDAGGAVVTVRLPVG